jgi:hypothetical protein
MSTTASTAPTSWKWTCSTGLRWTLASASASRAKVASDRSRTGAGRSASPRAPRRYAQVRMTCERSALTRTWVAPIPPRSAPVTSSSNGSTGTPASPDRSTSADPPASSSAPRTMSPATPAKQSK